MDYSTEQVTEFDLNNQVDEFQIKESKISLELHEIKTDRVDDFPVSESNIQSTVHVKTEIPEISSTELNNAVVFSSLKSNNSDLLEVKVEPVDFSFLSQEGNINTGAVDLRSSNNGDPENKGNELNPNVLSKSKNATWAIIENTKSMTREVKARTVNFTKEEELFLTILILKYKNLNEFHNFKTKSSSDMKTQEETWESILSEFNAIHKERTVRQLKSKFDNLKTAARKYQKENKQELLKNGGGLSNCQRNIILDNVLEIIKPHNACKYEIKFDDDNSTDKAGSGGLQDEEKKEDDEVINTDENNETTEDMQIDNMEVPAKGNLNNKRKWTRHYFSQRAEKRRLKKRSNNLTLKMKEQKILHDLKMEYLQQKIRNLKEENRRNEEMYQLEKRRKEEYHRMLMQLPKTSKE